MGTKLLMGVVFSVLLLSCRVQKSEDKEAVNWADSLSVMNFINKASLCQEIDLIKDSVDIFVNEKYPYSALLLSSIITQTMENIYIPIGKKYSGVPSIEQQKKEFEDEIIDIRNRFCK